MTIRPPPLKSVSGERPAAVAEIRCPVCLARPRRGGVVCPACRGEGKVSRATFAECERRRWRP